MRRPSRRTVLKGIGAASVAGLIGTNAMATESVENGETAWPLGHGTPGATNFTTGSGPGPYADRAWRTDRLPRDPAGVTVVDGTMYLAMSTSEPNNSKGAIVAYDTESGEQLWKRDHEDEIGEVFAAPTFHEGTLYIPTACAEQATYEMGPDPTVGGLFALDAETGEINWQFKMGAYWGGRALVHDGVVYAVSEAEHALYAVDAESGSEVWTKTNEDAGIDSPVLAGDTLYTTTRDEVMALGPDGTVQWTVDRPDGASGGVVATEDLLYISEVFAETADADKVWALSPDDGSVVWEAETTVESESGQPTANTDPTVGDGLVFVSAYNNGGEYNTLNAFDAETGKRQWTFSTHVENFIPPRPTMRVSATEDTVYVGTKQETKDPSASTNAIPTVYALDAGSGEEQWSYAVSEGHGNLNAGRCVPVDDRLYVTLTDFSNGGLADSKGWIEVFESSETPPNAAHTPVDHFSEKEDITAAITSDPQDAENKDFDSGATVTLSGEQSTSENGAITTFEWDIDGDGEYEKTGESVDVELDFCGILEMTLRVTDEAGKRDTETIRLSTV
ncbi:PQQ-binding-like beta-propeller repeat protein [Haladaptatus sp. DYSN1]|uniref:PQQ-binding-like beta-propeller repeat protein n=1 Tax=unclassified Haladaptatus TaxID=2622732 RepID=UPI002405BBED|nr:PQQ-binding-like beta-propeller repeat protein [Haladaptatus sp. DYSN1]